MMQRRIPMLITHVYEIRRLSHHAQSRRFIAVGSDFDESLDLRRYGKVGTEIRLPSFFKPLLYNLNNLIVPSVDAVWWHPGRGRYPDGGLLRYP